ncbi:hypothetical protein DPSP01_010578 [Paraphaeosphaeria sporulosa]
MELPIPTVTEDDLRQFHGKHFPSAPTPEHHIQAVDHAAQHEYYDEGDDGLGYYEDGVKRTLTDEEIAIFRHSEIQRILLERRRRKEAGEPIFDAHTPQVDTENVTALPGATSARAASPASDQSTPMSISSDDDDQTQAPPVEQPQQKWAVTSAKTRARNAKNRQKNRKNHRERKKEERKRQEREAKQARRTAEQQAQHEQDEESDEWDPWHQANGPDAQKEDAVDLEY